MNAAQPEASLSPLEAWFAAQPLWRRYAIAFVAGMIATLGQPPFQFVPAYVVAIVVLMWLLDASARPHLGHVWRKMLACGAVAFWFAFGHFTTGFYWIASAFQVEADTFGALGVPAVLGLAGGMALILWLPGGMFAGLLWTRGPRRIAGFTIAFMSAEWLRGHVFGGLPWLLPGYIWTPGEPVSQVASIFGIYGLSAITLLFAAAPATIADSGMRGEARFAPMVIAAATLGLIWGWGAQRLAHAPVDVPGAAPIIRVADAGMNQAEKWEDHPDQEWRVLDRYMRVTGTQEESHAQVVVWPEGAIPVVNFYTLENQAFLDEIGRGLGDRALVMGVTRRELQRDRIVNFNSAVIIDGVSGRPRIDMTQVYDKHRLVPWGEFIPLWSLFSRFNIAPLQQIGAGFTPGPPPTRRVIPDAPPAVILICYEAIFPGLIPRGDERPGWIIAISNDAWFGDGTGPYQHYVAARYRSIEEGLPMARAASGGISGIIDSFGRAVRETHHHGEAVEAQLPPSLPPVPHAVWGSLLIPLLAAFIAALRFAPVAAFGRGKEAR
ncbi:MAG: apolipoprotein N-acyltransferase [Pseudomonadota bacterium]